MAPMGLGSFCRSRDPILRRAMVSPADSPLGMVKRTGRSRALPRASRSSSAFTAMAGQDPPIAPSPLARMERLGPSGGHRKEWALLAAWKYV